VLKERSSPISPPSFSAHRIFGVRIHWSGISREYYYIRGRVVAKIALDVEEKAALQEEATVYRELRKVTDLPGSGIPSFVGLYDDVDDGVLVLVTTDVGDALCRYDKVNKK
jgi:hypothetical protein